MAKCDEGYRCDRCGGDVTSIVESDLYLRYVLGEIDAEHLHVASERHLSCNPVLTQYIDDERFEPSLVEGPFSKDALDKQYVQIQTERVTAGYRRLWEISESDHPISILDYPC